MPQVLATTVAQTSFMDMTLPVSAYVSGCPSSVIAAAAKRVITDLCDRAHVWKEYGAEVDVEDGVYEYTLMPAALTGEINDVAFITTTISDVTKDIYFQSLPSVKRAYPSWPTDTDGAPAVFTKVDEGNVWLAPVPDTDGVMTPYVSLRPTAAATTWPTSLYNFHKRVILHGVLHDLLMMPDRPWTNDKLALYHGKQWTYLLNSARVRAERGYNTADVSVQMVPMA